MLELYRRHLKDCQHAAKGQSYSLCACPIWCYGTLNGERIRQSMQTTDLVIARARMVKLESGAAVSGSSPTVAVAVEAFLAACRKRALADGSLTKYTFVLGQFSAFLKSATLAQIDGATIERFADDYRKVDYACTEEDQQPQAGMIRPSTWRGDLIVLQSFFEFALDVKWCSENPAKAVAMPKRQKLITPPFSTEECGALLRCADAITEDDIRRETEALLHVLLYTGLRIGDIAKLKREALNIKTGYLTLRTEKTGVSIKVKLKSSTITVLQRLPIRHPKYFFWDGSIKTKCVVVRLQRRLVPVAKAANVENVHPHRFRDTFAVELLTQGADIRTVQKLLGHSSVRTTEEHYAHFIHKHQDLLDAATARLDFDQSGAGSSGPFLVQTGSN